LLFRRPPSQLISGTNVRGDDPLYHARLSGDARAGTPPDDPARSPSAAARHRVSSVVVSLFHGDIQQAVN
jgi:hypothetical protein